MDLQQEYFKRHGIKTPLVLYPDTRVGNSLVLKNLGFRTHGRPRYFVVTTSFHKQEQHPSYYKFTMNVPLHDGSGHGNTLKPTWEKKVYWDEWERFVLEWSESNRGELMPLKGDQLSLALWEMFVYSHDSWLASNLQDRLKDNLCVAVDGTAPTEERTTAVKEVEEFIRGKNKSILSSLNNLRSYEGKPYADWLATLL